MPSARWKPSSRDWAVFGAMAALLVCLRVFLIVAQQWTPNFGGDLPEALISGRAAFDVLNGSWRGWSAYTYNIGGHLGNELAASMFALPLFWMFGPSLMALAAVPIAAAVATAALVFRLSQSRDAAILATAYLVFMPVAVQSWQIYPYFTHSEVCLWFLLALWILEPALRDASASRRPFAAGLVIGVAMVMCDMAVAALPASVAAWRLSRAPRPSRRFVISAAAGLSLGAAPYFAYAIIRPGSTATFYQTLFQYEGAPRDFGSYLQPFAYVSSMLWPFANGAGWLPIRLLIGLAGAIGVIYWARRLMRLPRPPFIDLAIIGFIVIVGAIMLMTGNAIEYYSYSLSAPIAFVAGGAIADLLGRWRSANARRVAICAVVATGLVCTVASLRRVDGAAVVDGWRATQVARGYAFYWPNAYVVFSGYKTPLGREVEAYVSRNQFAEQDSATPREKVISIAAGRLARHPLKVRADFHMYGADVTSLGVARLAAQAAAEVEPAFWPEAFGSIAVFAANDLLIEELVRLFADGTIDRSVPECCVEMFYSELGRKVRDRSARQRGDVSALLGGLSPSQRMWVDNGMTGSRYVHYDLPLWPGRR